MQLDTESLTTITAFVTSILATGASHGLMRAKIDRLERDVSTNDANFVSKELLAAKIEPIENDLHEIKKDVKRLLVIISRGDTSEIPS